MSESKGWSCYILECADGSYYVCVATNLCERVEEHNAAHGARAGVRRKRDNWRWVLFGSTRVSLRVNDRHSRIPPSPPRLASGPSTRCALSGVRLRAPVRLTRASRLKFRSHFLRAAKRPEHRDRQGRKAARD